MKPDNLHVFKLYKIYNNKMQTSEAKQSEQKAKVMGFRIVFL